MALLLSQMKALFPDPMRQGIVDLLWQSSGVMPFIPFIENAGLSYAYNARSKLPGVAFRNLNGTFSRTAGVVNPKTETLTILGGAIRTDSVAIALKGDKARSNEIAAQIQAGGKFFDKNFFNGDNTITGQGNQFLGLKKRLVNAQLVTNATDGAVIDGDKLIATQDAVEGANAAKILFMNQTTRRNLAAWAVNTADLNRSRYIEYRNGVLYFNGSQVVEVFYDETEAAILPFTETCGNNSLSSSVYCVKFGGMVDEQGVQALSGLPGNIQATGPFNYGEYVEDIVQMVVGIGLFSGHCAARLQGCKAT